MNCVHIAKNPNQRQYLVTPRSTGIEHALCFNCFEIYETNPRKQPWESVAYNLYRSTPGAPRNEWVRLNEKIIPPTESGKVQYLVKGHLIPDDCEVHVVSINAIGLESNPATTRPIKAPRLLLQTVVEFGETTEEGKLIKAVAVPWFEIVKILEKNPMAAFEIPPDKWEEIIAGAYRHAGFDEVTLTPRSGDYGRDVIAVKKGIGTVRVIDQVKAYKPGHLVTANDVRALVGVLHGDGASKGFLTTTSDFAPKLAVDPLMSQFVPSRIELINGEKLLKRLIELVE